MLREYGVDGRLSVDLKAYDRVHRTKLWGMLRDGVDGRLLLAVSAITRGTSQGAKLS